MQASSLILFLLRSQAKELANFVQTKRDLGCRANYVQIIEEGGTTSSAASKEFWKILGGQADYQCKRHEGICLALLDTPHIFPKTLSKHL